MHVEILNVENRREKIVNDVGCVTAKKTWEISTEGNPFPYVGWLFGVGVEDIQVISLVVVKMFIFFCMVKRM